MKLPTMKLSTMSVAVVITQLLSVNAYAINNVKINGDAKLYYSTKDDAGSSLFNKKGAMGQGALGLGASADLTKGVTAGAHLTALSTLGLQNQLVDGVWESTNGVSDSYWFDEAWLAATMGKTTAKVGRMALDTPIVFTETWSIVKNTFEAAVLINQDLPDTTLIAAFVGGTNSNNIVNPVTGSSTENGTQYTGLGNSNAGVVQNFNKNGTTNFGQFYRGAYAIAAINNSIKPLTLQGWAYSAPQYLTAYWLQADYKSDGILVGGQYTKTNYNKSAQLPIAKDSNNDAWALMAGYTMKNIATVKVAFSQTGTETDSTIGLGAGMNLAGSQSKLYTEAWWNYGYVTRADTSAYNITVSGNLADFELAAYYTATNSGNNNNTVIGKDLKEFTLTGSRSFGPLDATLAYINTNADDQNNGSSYNTVQAYLTYKF